MPKKTDVAKAVEILVVEVGRPLHLEAEVVRSKLPKFRDDYRKRAGYDLPFEGLHLISEGTKWGLELRIYFNSSDAVVDRLRELGFHVEEDRPFNPNYRYRINNNLLWWALIDAGLTLGVNQ